MAIILLCNIRLKRKIHRNKGIVEKIINNPTFRNQIPGQEINTISDPDRSMSAYSITMALLYPRGTQMPIFAVFTLMLFLFFLAPKKSFL